jgi:hypothetical protein
MADKTVQLCRISFFAAPNKVKIDVKEFEARETNNCYTWKVEQEIKSDPKSRRLNKSDFNVWLQTLTDIGDLRGYKIFCFPEDVEEHKKNLIAKTLTSLKHDAESINKTIKNLEEYVME